MLRRVSNVVSSIFILVLTISFAIGAIINIFNGEKVMLSSLSLLLSIIMFRLWNKYRAAKPAKRFYRSSSAIN